MNNAEKFKRIETHPNYFITSKGNIYRQYKTKPGYIPVKTYTGGSNGKNNPKGKYQVVGLYKKGVRTQRYVHQLVLEAFVEPKQEGMQTLHGDGNRMNNDLSNLRWGTAKENAQDRIKHAAQEKN